MLKISRQAYLAGEISHQAYYGEIARRAKITYIRSPMLSEIKKALANGDECLNTIPLYVWDIQVVASKSALVRAIKTIPNESLTEANGVSIHKAAAKRSARLSRLLDDGTIVLSTGYYFGTAADGVEVHLGAEDEEAYLESYLEEHPTPETW